MIIEKIEIGNFWLEGKDIIWELKPDVNVLVGKNGTGKTTLINLIEATLQGTSKEKASFFFDENERLFAMVEYVKLQFQDDRYFEIDSSSGFSNDKNIEKGSILFSKIQTFDVEQDLTKLLTKLIADFLAFQSSLKDDLEKIYFGSNGTRTNEKNPILENFGNEIERRNDLIGKIDDLFLDKKIEIKDDFYFHKENSKVRLTIKHLSSGEKQVLAILLSVFLQHKKPFILLLDEPEISLHVEWQNLLFKYMREINPNCQIIAVTHSSSLYAREWRDNMKIFAENEIVFPSTPRNSLQINPQISIDIDEFVENVQRIRNNNFDNFALIEINKFLKSEYEALNLEDCKQVLEKMKNNRCKPDVFTLTILISKLNSVEDSQKLISIGKDLYSIDPNGYTLNEVIKKSTSLEEGLSIFNKYITNYPNFKPDIVTFSVLLSKAKSFEEIETIEETREYYQIEKNTIYNSKLKFRYHD